MMRRRRSGGSKEWAREDDILESIGQLFEFLGVWMFLDAKAVFGVEIFTSKISTYMKKL